MPPSPVVMTLRGWNENADELGVGADRLAPVGRADRAGGVLDDGDAARVAAARGSRRGRPARRPGATTMTALVAGVSTAVDRLRR